MQHSIQNGHAQQTENGGAQANPDGKVQEKCKHGRGDKSPESPFLPTEQSNGTNEVEDSRNNQNRESPCGQVRNIAPDHFGAEKIDKGSGRVGNHHEYKVG